MTSKEWNTGIEFLESAKEGFFVENLGRTVEVVNMIAGRFMLLDKNGTFAGVVDEEWRAMEFLKSGKVLMSKF